MRLRVLAIGQKMPAWVDQGVEEYARRMPREISVEWLDIPPAKRGSATPEKYRVQEAEAIEAKLSGKDYVVALDISGKAVSTELIAERFDQWQMQGEQISIVIGGPDGLHPNILKGAKGALVSGADHPAASIGKGDSREQLYRAWSVQAGHPYHRGS
jgi:23S rRNA (pseudouridine1915-N3)-methyltransferase